MTTFVKRKIALVISSMRSGGAERVMANLVNYWAGQGHDVTLVLFTPPSEASFYKLDERVKVVALNCLSYHKNPLIYLKNMIRCLVRIRRAMKALRPDAVVSFLESVNMAVLVATLGLRVPVIVCEHTDPHFHKIYYLYNKCRNLIYLLANKIIVLTQNSKLFFSTRMQNKIIVLPNPVAQPQKVKTGQSLVVKKLMSVGRLAPSKNYAMLIRTFAKLDADLTLEIYGEGPEQENLQNLIQELKLDDRVFLRGNYIPIEDKLVEADLFVFPTQYEGFPNSICEAMSVGLPVIASNVVGNTELVLDQKTGLLFEFNNIDDACEKINILIQNKKLREEVVTCAKEFIKRFDEETIYSKWDQLLINLCLRKEK
jgi:glycosyltransferase involved in cell wall biosynthesis